MKPSSCHGLVLQIAAACTPIANARCAPRHVHIPIVFLHCFASCRCLATARPTNPTHQTGNGSRRRCASGCRSLAAPVSSPQAGAVRRYGRRSVAGWAAWQRAARRAAPPCWRLWHAGRGRANAATLLPPMRPVSAPCWLLPCRLPAGTPLRPRAVQSSDPAPAPPRRPSPAELCGALRCGARRPCRSAGVDHPPPEVRAASPPQLPPPLPPGPHRPLEGPGGPLTPGLYALPRRSRAATERGLNAAPPGARLASVAPLQASCLPLRHPRQRLDLGRPAGPLPAPPAG